MSTQINVIVDDGGLSEKARQQVQANRWQKLEQAQRAKVEQKAQKQRDAQRLQNGIGFDGRPLYGSASARSLRLDELAANRLGDYSVLLLLADEFKDKSKYRNLILPQGAQLSPTAPRYGSHSFYFPGDINAFQTLNAAITSATKVGKYGLPVSTQDFTIEMWVKYERYPGRPDSGSVFWPTFMRFPESTFSLDIFEGYLDIWQNSTPALGTHNNGIAVPGSFLLHQQFIEPQVWTHCCAMRTNGAVTLFVNGVPSLTQYTFDYSLPSGVWQFGSWSEANFEYQGFLDDIRISHGAKYSIEGFIPPARQHPIP